MIIATSAYANKLLRQLDEEKSFLEDMERASYIYTVSADEEPVIPEYDFEETAARLNDICDKIQKIKHAVNVANTTQPVRVGDKDYTVDTILVRMAQLNRRKSTLDSMRKRTPKERVKAYSSSGRAAEYICTNYDISLAKQEFERVSKEIIAMQLALDRHNQTYSFEIDIDF